jgi:hypothetical protein
MLWATSRNQLFFSSWKMIQERMVEVLGIGANIICTLFSLCGILSKCRMLLYAHHVILLPCHWFSSVAHSTDFRRFGLLVILDCGPPGTESPHVEVGRSILDWRGGGAQHTSGRTVGQLRVVRVGGGRWTYWCLVNSPDPWYRGKHRWIQFRAHVDT